MPGFRQEKVSAFADHGETVEMEGIRLPAQHLGERQYLVDVPARQGEHDHG